MCNLRTTVGVAVLVWTCGVSQGGITYDAQSRSVSALAAPSSDGASAPDFGSFQASRSASSIYGTGAWASQSSVLLDEGMFTQGGCGSNGGMQFFSASARSTFDVTFTVDDPRQYRFWGGVTLDAFEATANGEVMLTGPNGAIYENFGAGDWDMSGIAEPGQYRLLIRVTTSAAGGPISSTGLFYGGFVIPGPGSACVLMGLCGLGTRRRR